MSSNQSPLKIVEHFDKLRLAKTHMKNVDGSDSKLQRAKQLLQKEENNAKMSRLESLLVQQYIGKYGSKNPASNVNMTIKRCVRHFLRDNGADNIDNHMIDILERKVRELTQVAKDEIITSRQEEQRVKSHEEQRLRNEMKKKNSQAQNVNPNAANVELNQWAVVNALQAINDREDRMAEVRKDQERKSKFKEQLDDQIEMRQQKHMVMQEAKKKDLAAATA